MAAQRNIWVEQCGGGVRAERQLSSFDSPSRALGVFPYAAQ